jgi:6-pyruvoyltetrahydropterin/6-carboxytetrahydropterin synthase
MMRIYKEFTFEAAHFLPSSPKGGPSSRLHGHSFLVRVSVDGEPDPETGLLLHLEDFAEKLSALKDKLDHRLLNEIEALETPTLERIAAWVWRELEPELLGLAEVQVSRPTCREGCIYSGPEKRPGQ